MQRRMKYRGREKPLLVTEIIIPDKPDAPHSTGSKEPALRIDNLDVITDRGSYEESVPNLMKVGNHEVKEIMGLVNLTKKPLVNYFEGTRENKQTRKKKERHRKVVHPSSVLFCDEAQSSSKVCHIRKPPQPEELLTKEEKTEMQLLQMKIYKQEIKRKHAVEKNYVKQRMAEKEYIQQFEKLTETWFRSRKRKNRLKSDISHLSSAQEKTCSKIGIFPTHKKEYTDEPEFLSKKLEKCKEDMEEKDCQTIQTLNDDFYEKLVFVDEESDDFQNDC